jgi:hypothetical protein
MSSIETDKLVDGLKEYFETPEMKNLIEKVFHGPFKLSKITQVIALVYEAVIAAEKLANDIEGMGTGAGKEKKEAVVKWMEEAIHLPFYLEPFDGLAISMAVDAIVLWFNLRIGKNWLTVIQKIL